MPGNKYKLKIGQDEARGNDVGEGEYEKICQRNGSPSQSCPKNKDGETTVHAERAAFAKAQGHEIRRWYSRTGASSVLLPHKIQVGDA